jgi:hypothetical protein
MHIGQHVLRDGHLLQYTGSRKVFGDFDLDIAEVSLPCYALALFLVWIIRFGCTRCATFQPAIPIVRGEGLAFVSLSGAVGIDIVDMGEIDLKPVTCLVAESRWERSKIIILTVLRSG